MTSERRKRVQRSAKLNILLGIGGTVVLLVLVAVAWRATSGLPFVPSYQLFVELENAQRVQAASAVRIGGVRVGQVKSVSAVPASGSAGTHATLELSLDPALAPLPADTEAQVRPASILGATFLDLAPGTSEEGIESGGTIPVSQATASVELTDLLDVFDDATARGLRGSIEGLSDGVAGRGLGLNRTIGATRDMLPALRRVARALSSPEADLPRFLRGLDATVAALGPVAPELGSLIEHGETTLAAISDARGALAESIEALPGTEATATVALARLSPTLERLAELELELTPGARLLPDVLPSVNDALAAGISPLGDLPPFLADLEHTFGSLERLSRSPSTSRSLRVLRLTVNAAGTLLRTLTPAQLQCNIIPLYARNVVGSLPTGTEAVPFLRVALAGVGGQNESLQNATPSPNLHVNYLPKETRRQCESGNEPYDPDGSSLANPPGLQPNETEETRPPADATAQAEQAGLLDDLEGGP